MNTATIITSNENTSRRQSSPYRIIVVRGEAEIREHLKIVLLGRNFFIDFVENPDDLLAAPAEEIDTPSLVIVDVARSRNDEIALVKRIRRHNRSLPVLVLSSASSAANRVQAMDSGANDFLTKPVSYEQLHQTIDRLLPPRPSPVVARSAVGFSCQPDVDLKVSSWIRRIEPLLDRLAGSDVPILLQGETGVGKEILARQIHNQSLRSGKIFLKLNCAALPSELVESELFGYERGAFTGAFKSTPGKFELAHGGTILLDEIGDMDLRLQAKLLQVLQDREFHRIGAKESTQVDVRVIAATHRELESRIARGEFREDLFYRLNVVNIVIPPLRERLDEIIPLATSFLRKHIAANMPLPEIGAALRAALLRHQWPGNVRELENLMRRYLVVRSQEALVDELQACASRVASRHRPPAPDFANDAHSRWSVDSAPASADLFFRPTPVPSMDPASRTFRPNGGDSINRTTGDGSELVKLDKARQAAETEVIMKALHMTQWNRKRAASLLEVDYKALLYKMKKLGID